MLDARKRKILQALITDYISTAEPIGSRTIARKYDLGVSPATIRNEMADLEVLGYIEQPHTSAGRIPSVKGYRFYVDSLLSPEQVSDNEKVLIQNWYNAKVRRVEEVFQETAKIISRMTKNISMVLAPQFSQCIFKYLQFLPLDERRVILVVVTDTGFVENKVISFPEGMTFADLQQIAAGINSRLAGLPFDKIKSSILREIQNDIIQDRRLFDIALGVLHEALSVEKNERVYLGGTTQLLNQPEFRDVDKVKELLNILEQEKLLRDIMHVSDKDGISVKIGEENKYTGIQDCSMVQATYSIDGQVVGSIAVLGPTRMEYGKVMAILEFMHGHLEEILKKYKV
ncbi:MAG: heat-inducible transcription repressor HrcA [Veillonellaceae bacterium]|nr:heat-inducible transcription repressor HrcA [Veillonellaceae bacterium]